jgi:hypothetical protein
MRLPAQLTVFLFREPAVGSVGVITMHLDWTQRIKDDGLKVTIITFGVVKRRLAITRTLKKRSMPSSRILTPWGIVCEYRRQKSRD